MPSLRRHLGELTIDHRASPGTPQVPEGTLLEVPHFMCPHCGATVIMEPRRVRPRNYCAKCDRNTCDTKGCVIDCTPMQACAELVLAHPDSNIPFMRRGPNGEVLFDRALLDRSRIF